MNKRPPAVVIPFPPQSTRPPVPVENTSLPTLVSEAMLLAQLETIRDHVYEYANAVGADLETGSHHRNNQAAEEFHRQFRFLNRWVERLFELVEEHEGSGSPTVDSGG